MWSLQMCSLGVLSRLVVRSPVPARAFQLAAWSAPRTHGRPGGALCARAVHAAEANAVQDVDKRLAACHKELEVADKRISKAETALEKTPDSETKRLLSAAMETKNLMLKKKASLEAEKKDQAKQKAGQAKQAARKVSKTFWFTNPDDGTTTQFVVRASEWERFYSYDAGGALRDVEDTTASAVVSWVDVVDGKEYTTVRSDLRKLDAKIERQQKTIDNPFKADEDAMGRMLATWTEKCYKGVAVPPARKIYKWPDARAAESWNTLVEEWIAATPEGRADVEAKMNSLKKEAEIPEDDDKAKDSGKIVMEFDAVVFSTDGTQVSIAEAKSTPSDTDIRAFAEKMGDTRLEANTGDTKFQLFRNRRILPVFYGNRLAPRPEGFWKKLADENNIVVLTRSGNEMHHVINADAPQDGDIDGLCTFLERILK